VKVVDAGVLVDLFAHDLDPERLGVEALVAPHLIDSEVLNVLRRMVGRGRLTASQGDLAVAAFMAFELVRLSADVFRPRMWELRDDLSAYDATYVALAESIGATALLTTDARLANAPGIRCAVEVL
jgi:predicted nucleic acid-binding protein